MIGRTLFLSLARFSDPREKPRRKTIREWLCSKGWHWWRRSGWAYGVDSVHDYRVRTWYCARRVGRYDRDGMRAWCPAQFIGPKEILGEHNGL